MEGDVLEKLAADKVFGLQKKLGYSFSKEDRPISKDLVVL